MRLHHWNTLLLSTALCVLSARADRAVFDDFIESEDKALEQAYLKERDEAIKNGLSVHVVDEAGNDIQGVTVALNDRIIQFTDAKGVTVFLDMKKDDYLLEMSSRGYTPIDNYAISYDPADPKGMPKKLTMKARPVTLVVGVMDVGGLVLNDVELKLGNRTLKTNAKGVARIDNVKLNKGELLSARKPGFSAWDQKVILPPRNWSTEVYKTVILRRLEQLHVSVALSVIDSASVPPNNGDGKANAGESIKLPVTVQNKSKETTDAWKLAFKCDSAFLEFTGKTVFECQPLKPNEKKGFMIDMKVNRKLWKTDLTRIVATTIPKNDFLGKQETALPLPLYPGIPLDFKLTAKPIVKDPRTGDLAQRNNGNNVLGPGEYGVIKLAVGNQGKAIKNVTFDLQTVPSHLLPPKAIKREKRSKTGMDIKANQVVAPVFNVDVPRGYDYRMLPFILIAESHGRIWSTKFNLPVEGKSDFHATMVGKGKLSRGSICNFIIKATYAGEEEFKGNYVLSSLGGRIKTEPSAFRGRTIEPNKTMELEGMMMVPHNYKEDTFKMKLSLEDISLNNTVLFERDFRFRIEKPKQAKD